MGNQTIKINLGKHSTEAMQAIELKCGGSTFKMTPASIEMKSMMIKIEGSMMFETKGLMMKQEASAIHIVKGGLVMIN
jgi:type VI secretion system secreted protein VgrG